MAIVPDLHNSKPYRWPAKDRQAFALSAIEIAEQPPPQRKTE